MSIACEGELNPVICCGLVTWVTGTIDTGACMPELGVKPRLASVGDDPSICAELCGPPMNGDGAFPLVAFTGPIPLGEGNALPSNCLMPVLAPRSLVIWGLGNVDWEPSNCDGSSSTPVLTGTFGAPEDFDEVSEACAF